MRFKDILAFFESRMQLSKTIRQRMVRVPFDLDYPYWIEDPDFDLEYHVRHVALPQPVVDALLHNTGVFAPFLELTKACESGDEVAFAKNADALHLSNRQVNWAHLQALTWAESLNEE